MQQILGKIRCRVNLANTHGLKLYLYGSSAECVHELCECLKECEFDDEGKTLTGACLADGGILLARTSAEAELQFHKNWKHRHIEANHAELLQRESRIKENLDFKDSSVSASWVFPERRWPPMPCSPEAYYRSGKWFIDSCAVTQGHDAF